MCWCIYVSVCPSYVSMNLCMFVSACLCVYVSMHRSPLSLFLFLVISLSIYRSIYQAVYLSTHPSVHHLSSPYPSAYLPTYLSIYLSIDLSIYLSHYLSIYVYFLYPLSNPSQPWIFCHPIYLYLVFLLCIRVLIKNLTDIFTHISVVCNVLAYAGIFVCLYVSRLRIATQTKEVAT